MRKWIAPSASGYRVSARPPWRAARRTPAAKRSGDLDEGDSAELDRRAARTFVAEDKQRAKQPRVKEAIVRHRGYKNLFLKAEDIAEFDYRPKACKRSYRVVVLRKNITVERGETALFDEIRYFFYITNQREMPAAQVVFEANDRCNQENLIAQLKDGGVRALHAPLNTLDGNWPYMVMAALAWSLKDWMALSLPIHRAVAQEAHRPARPLAAHGAPELPRSGHQCAGSDRTQRAKTHLPPACLETDLPVLFRLLSAP